VAGIIGLLWVNASFVGCTEKSGKSQEAHAMTIFVAASLTDVVDQIARDFTDQTGMTVRLSAAGSSMLARQIEAGAKADVFLSADALWVDYLDGKGLIDSSSRMVLASNQLVFIAPVGSDIAIEMVPGFDINSALPGRLSIADPDHVPAGRYARKALESLGWWDELKSRIAPALDVRSALAMVARGEAPLGIVYRTDAMNRTDVRIVAEIDTLHTGPVQYVGCLVNDADSAAGEFLQFLRSEPAMKRFTDAGFVAPDRAEP